MAEKKKTPIKKAQRAMSAAGLKDRVDRAEARALGTAKRMKAPARKPKVVAKKTTVYKPPAKGVAARKAAIAKQRAADRAAIAAMRKKKAAKKNS